ncbi:class III extradiol ring-cleavage dioxygenase [Pseudoxanthobacter sp.]|uniref:DODA-type extradiol aromatic ring-opening family dioxygenase n=1 Tax=Pseudoxanthobacter sp. TaxID=1925742 RepID=UPI002FE3AF41
MLPTLFISHGAPNMALYDSPARRFMLELGARLPRPKAILSVSAHFMTAKPVVIADSHPEMIYDFGGFEPELYQKVYPAPGDPELAARVAEKLTAGGVETVLATGRGFDHGTWVPLSLIYPKADIPVVTLSIQPRLDPAHHFRVGQALQGLAAEGVLVMASGSITHNLGEVFDRRSGRMMAMDAPDTEWARSFTDWFADRMKTGAVADLIGYRSRAPHAVRAHPHDDHLLPLFVALGAAGAGATTEVIHSSGQFGSLMMDAYAFHPAAEGARQVA